MKGDGCGVDVGESEIFAGGVRDNGVGVVVVEDVVGEVGGDTGRVLIGDWADEDGGAVKVLEVDAECRWIVGIYVEQGVHERCSIYGLLVESMNAC